MKLHKLSIILLCLWSCVDNRYDLTDINSDVSWGGDALTIPLISTKKIVLRDILNDEAKELLNEMDGKYGIVYKTDIPTSTVDVPKINFSIDKQTDESEVSFSDFDFSSYIVEIPDFENFIKIELLSQSKLPKSIAQQLPQRQQYNALKLLKSSDPISPSTNVKIELSPSIAAVKRLNFKENATISFSTSVVDAYGQVLPERLLQRIATRNFAVKLPSILKCTSNDPKFNDQTNEYQFAEGILNGSFTVNTHAIDFGTYKTTTNGFLDFELTYSTQGEVYITNLDSLSFEDISLLNNATIRQNIHFTPLSIKNADIIISELVFQSGGIFNWGENPITEIPDVFERITTLQVKGDTIYFDLKVEGDLHKFGDLIIPNLQIVLPDYLFTNGKHIISYKNLKIDQHTGRVTTPITAQIDSLFFPQGKPIVDGTFDIKGNIDYFIEIIKPTNAANVGEINSLNFMASMTAGQQSITHLKGHISKVINYSTNINVDRLPYFLKNEKNSLLFPNMHLELELEHNIGFNMFMGLIATPIGENGEKITENIVKTDGESLKIAPKFMREQTTQKIWIAATDHGMPKEFQFVQIANISNLVRTIPETLNLNITLRPDPSQLDYIEANKTYNISGNTQFKIPFVFGSGFKLYYDDIIQLDDVLSDEILDILFSNSNNELQLLINMYNTIPLHLIGSFAALDENSAPLNNVIVTPNSFKPTIILPGTEGNEKMTPMVMSIKGSKAEIKRLKQIKYQLLIEAKEGESTAGGASISPTNSIRMDIKGRVLGNATFKE